MNVLKKLLEYLKSLVKKPTVPEVPKSNTYVKEGYVKSGYIKNK